MTDPTSPNGLLVIDKPLGWTSMGVCKKVRWLLVQGGAKKKVKVGHAGTLDPLATGVLVVLVGKATKLQDRYMAGEKEYVAEIDLAHFSTTDDREGERTDVEIDQTPSREDVERACRKFVGEIAQRPPAYSAMKVDGKRAYKLARQGEQVELKARPVIIHEIGVVEYAYPRLVIDVRCGKGTYIRSLARDLGETLGTGGMLDGLRRTRVGEWGIDRARTIESLPEPMTEKDLIAL